MNDIKKNRKGRMSQMTFVEFLKEHHAITYIGTDDNMLDAYDDWTTNLQADDWEELGEQYGIMLRDSVND